MVEQNWARDRGYEIGDRVRVAGPTGRTELPIIGIFKLTSSLNVGGLGYAAMPLAAARRVFDQPKGWMQISIAAMDRGEVGPAQEARRAGRGQRARTCRPPASSPDQIERAARRTEHGPLLLLGRRAVRGRLPDPEQLQHDGAPAHARARHAPHARRVAADGDRVGADRGARDRRRRHRCSGSRSGCGWPPG